MKKIFKESGLFLLLLLCLVLLTTICQLFVHIRINQFTFIFSFIISSIIYIIFKRKILIKKEFIKIIGLSIVVIAFSILSSTFMFDRSSDGNTYHKDAVGVLKEGFNPIYQSSYDFIKQRDDFNSEFTDYTIWTDHYAKANWLIEASIYSFTGNIESAKAINIISVYIVFSIIFSFLLEKMNIKKALILSLITVFNPIVCSQLFTFYNDILVCLYLLLAVFMLIKIDNNINDKECWIIYILTFIILANTKFNGLGYLLVFSFLFVCKYLYKSFQNKEFLNIFKKLCIIFIPLFIVSIIIVGYPTYIKNTIDHQNPFFPLYDDNGEDIITAQEPEAFLKYNNIQKLFYGTFSKANNLLENDNTTLKIPFTIHKDEIVPAMSNDLRISGWGILYSGLLIISIAIYIFYYKYYKKENWILYTIGITTLLLLVISESWWARYTPHFYLFILLSLYIMFTYNKRKIINYIYTFIIIVNSLIPLAGNTYYTLTNSIRINKDLKYLSKKEIVLNENNYYGILYNLKDYKIKYSFDQINGKELYYHYLEYQEVKR